MITLFAMNGMPIHINPDHVLGVKIAADGKGVLTTTIGTEIKTGISANLCADLLRAYPDDWVATPHSYTLQGAREEEYLASGVACKAQPFSGLLGTGQRLDLMPVPIRGKATGGSVSGLLKVANKSGRVIVFYSDTLRWSFSVKLISGTVVDFDDK